MRKPKFRVYLAGPISGCNDAQMRRWRESVKEKYNKHFDFIDPVGNLLDGEANAHAVVEADIRSIENADGLLINMWRESIGAGLGAVHAHRRGRPVVVSDPNHLQNCMLAFYADVVTDNPLKGAKALLDLLRAESNWVVVRSGEPRGDAFDRRRLMTAIQDACRQAGRDDIVIPRLVLPSVIESLQRSDRRIRREISTATIDQTVTAVLDGFRAQPAYAEAAADVLQAWRSQGGSRKRPNAVRETPPSPISTATSVPISCGKSHGTIWGTTVNELHDVPLPAREVFKSISSVSGITAIKLGPFGRKGKRNTCQAWVKESPEPFVLDGQLFDLGEKGTAQSFQVRVQAEADKPAVAAAIERELRSIERWTDPPRPSRRNA